MEYNKGKGLRKEEQKQDAGGGSRITEIERNTIPRTGWCAIKALPQLAIPKSKKALRTVQKKDGGELLI